MLEKGTWLRFFKQKEYEWTQGGESMMQDSPPEQLRNSPFTGKLPFVKATTRKNPSPNL